MMDSFKLSAAEFVITYSFIVCLQWRLYFRYMDIKQYYNRQNPNEM